MKARFFLITVLVLFVGLCAGLIIKSISQVKTGLGTNGTLRLLASTTQEREADSASENATLLAAGPAEPASGKGEQGYDFTVISAWSAKPESVKLGSVSAATGFKFELELSSLGACIRQATFSEYDNRDRKDPQPLVFLSPVGKSDGSEVLSMASGGLDLGAGQKDPLPLDKLHWKLRDVTKQGDFEKAVFEAIVQDRNDKDALRLTKTFTVTRGRYHLDCELQMENLSDRQLKPAMFLQGPAGIGREDVRSDMRKVVGGFIDTEGQVTSSRLELKHLRRPDTPSGKRLSYKDASAKFIWAAAVNKYFAAILRPVPEQGQDRCRWVTDKTGRYYDPDGKQDSEDETVGFGFSIGSIKLAPAGRPESSRMLDFQLYLGPKDKNFFQKNDLYRRLGFFHTIDFRTCCCPASIVNPLAFGILSLMKWMHGFWPHNYGIVIIILVVLIRLLLHPVTKKSQVSMMKYSKLAPKVAEIRKQYPNNQAEAHKQILAYYKEQGVSPVPIMGMLPMLVQMPIWIALWSAINASINLRGAEFLPFWITDLSVPDALVSFSAVTVPLLGWKISSLNMLPILMGVAFFLQQKLMPHQSPDASANPQTAQQQKIMMIMLPVLFPLMLYNGPSGVNLYIMASVFAGVFEQYVIRKHIREKEAQQEQVFVSATAKTGGKAKKKKPKPMFKY